MSSGEYSMTLCAATCEHEAIGWSSLSSQRDTHKVSSQIESGYHDVAH